MENIFKEYKDYTNWKKEYQDFLTQQTTEELLQMLADHAYKCGRLSERNGCLDTETNREQEMGIMAMDEIRKRLSNN